MEMHRASVTARSFPVVSLTVQVDRQVGWFASFDSSFRPDAEAVVTSHTRHFACLSSGGTSALAQAHSAIIMTTKEVFTGPSHLPVRQMRTSMGLSDTVPDTRSPVSRSMDG